MSANTEVDQTNGFLRSNMWFLLQCAYSAYERDIHYHIARPFEAGYRDINYFLLDGSSMETINRAVALGYIARSTYTNDKDKEIYVIRDKGMDFLRSVIDKI